MLSGRVGSVSEKGQLSSGSQSFPRHVIYWWYCHRIDLRTCSLPPLSEWFGEMGGTEGIGEWDW